MNVIQVEHSNANVENMANGRVGLGQKMLLQQRAFDWHVRPCEPNVNVHTENATVLVFIWGTEIYLQIKSTRKYESMKANLGAIVRLLSCNLVSSSSYKNRHLQKYRIRLPTHYNKPHTFWKFCALSLPFIPFSSTKSNWKKVPLHALHKWIEECLWIYGEKFSNIGHWRGVVGFVGDVQKSWFYLLMTWQLDDGQAN